MLRSAGGSLPRLPFQNRACDFHRTRLLVLQAVVIGIPTKRDSADQLSGPCASVSRYLGICHSDTLATNRPAFQQAAPTSAYPEHYLRPWLLGRSYSRRALVGCLLRHVGEPLQGFPVPCIDGSVRVGPCYTPGPQRVETENHIAFSVVCQASVRSLAGDRSLLGLPMSQCWQVRLNDASAHVRFRCPYSPAGRDSATGWRLPPSLPRSRRLRASRPPQADAFTLST